VQGQVTDLHMFECIEGFVQVTGENTRLQAIVGIVALLDSLLEVPGITQRSSISASQSYAISM
jgi:hypothetical protein